jgi:hypothetical protein
MLSCSIWFSAPSLWMGGGPESRCVGRVCGLDGAVQGTVLSCVISLRLPNNSFSNMFTLKIWSSHCLQRCDAMYCTDASQEQGSSHLQRTLNVEECLLLIILLHGATIALMHT